MSNKIELKKEEVVQLIKRADIIGQRKLELSMLERESAYKIMEFVADNGGDISSPWAWEGSFLVKKSEAKNV
jgi:hypothetical protein